MTSLPENCLLPTHMHAIQSICSYRTSLTNQHQSSQPIVLCTSHPTYLSSPPLPIHTTQLTKQLINHQLLPLLLLLQSITEQTQPTLAVAQTFLRNSFRVSSSVLANFLSAVSAVSSSSYTTNLERSHNNTTSQSVRYTIYDYRMHSRVCVHIAMWVYCMCKCTSNTCYNKATIVYSLAHIKSHLTKVTSSTLRT